EDIDCTHDLAIRVEGIGAAKANHPRCRGGELLHNGARSKNADIDRCKKRKPSDLGLDAHAGRHHHRKRLAALTIKAGLHGMVDRETVREIEAVEIAPVHRNAHIPLSDGADDQPLDGLDREFETDTKIDEIRAVQLEAKTLRRVDEMILCFDGAHAAGAALERRPSRVLDIFYDVDRVIEEIPNVEPRDNRLRLFDSAEIKAQVRAKPDARSRPAKPNGAEAIEETHTDIAAKIQEREDFPNALHPERRDR